MRIVGGKNRGYRFHPPSKNPARPTTDFAKEGLFNILQNTFNFEEVSFLDLFGGTGSISFEFASRGCQDITNVELFMPNVAFITRTAEELDFQITALRLNVFDYLKKFEGNTYDVIFAGPPYPLKTLDTLPDEVLGRNYLAENGWFILEHNPSHNFDDDPRFLKKRNYGSTIFSIFNVNQKDLK